MAILTLRLPEVNLEAERPRSCPHCGAGTLQRRGGRSKAVRDTEVAEVRVYRYMCTVCRKTFTSYPKGVTRAQQSVRLVVLAGILWSQGLTLRAVTAVLGLMDLLLCHETVRQDALALAEKIKASCRKRGRVRVLGVDGTGARIKGKTGGAVMALDMGTGRPLFIEFLDEKNPEAVKDWLLPIVTEYGVEVIVTDDLASYGVVARDLELDHQRCIFHLMRHLGRLLRELRELLGEDLLPIADQVEAIAHALEPTGGHELYKLWEAMSDAKPPGEGEKASPAYRLRQLILRLSEHWSDYLLYQRQPDVPTTNNQTEYGFSRGKTRFKSFRGVKSKETFEAMFFLRTYRPLVPATATT